MRVGDADDADAVDTIAIAVSIHIQTGNSNDRAGTRPRREKTMVETVREDFNLERDERNRAQTFSLRDGGGGRRGRRRRIGLGAKRRTVPSVSMLCMQLRE